MSKLILQMIYEEEKLIKPNKSKRIKNYNGNLVTLRLKRERLLLKKHRLNLEIKKYNKMTVFARESIFDNIERLSKQIDIVNKEILKVQEGMQNSGQWLEDNFSF